MDTQYRGRPSREEVVLVGTSTTVIAAARNDRRGLILQNNGAFPVTIRLDGTTPVVVGAGLVLSKQAEAGAAGGSLPATSVVVSTSEITAISSGGASNVYVCEFSGIINT